MNEINFNIEDVEKIDLSLDFAVKKMYPELEDLEVTPSAEEQVFTHEGSYGYDKVVVHKIEQGFPSEYFNETITGTTAYSQSGVTESFKKIPSYTNTGTTCANMFAYILVEEIDLSNFNTENVTTMQSMFRNCMKLERIDLSYLDTKNVTTMQDMFGSCIKLANIDVSNFNTENVTNMNSMFNSCSLLTELDVTNFDTKKVTNMSSMFYGCSNLTRLDLSTWETPVLKNMSMMFHSCSKLKYLDIRKFDFTNVTSYNNTFYRIPTDCEIIVKDDTAKAWVLAKRSDLTNVKTVGELG